MKPLSTKKRILLIAVIAVLVAVAAFFSLFVGPSKLGFADSLRALFGQGSAASVRILQKIRLPRMFAALLAGAGLSLSGLIMQTCLNNAMASPATLGVSNAAVFGANLSIVLFSGGFIATGNHADALIAGANPYSTSIFAFVFAILSVLLILGLGRIRAFSPSVIVLAGIALGAVFTAATTLLQFYATDVGLSAAVIWSFGDLGRATTESNLILLAVVFCAALFFFLESRKLNALLSGSNTASTLGVRVGLLRFAALFLASFITAVAVSTLGMIGFVGVICPHVAKKIFGEDHRFSIPASLLFGSLLLILADAFSRSIGSGSALPVGAVTALLGAPFFLTLIFTRKEAR